LLSDVQEASALFIQVFQDAELIAETTVDAAHCLQVESGDTRTLRLWDVKTETAIGSALEGHGWGVISVTFSPDGSKLASASNGNSAWLWDMATGAAIGSAIEGHNSYVNSVVFSPDGSKLASASYDNTVRLWPGNVETGALSRVIVDLSFRSSFRQMGAS
jgi:WD40 repeat protein